MTCCVQDIQFAGIICVWDRADEIRNDEWAIITARLDYKFHRAYGLHTVQSVQEVEKAGRTGGHVLPATAAKKIYYARSRSETRMGFFDTKNQPPGGRLFF